MIIKSATFFKSSQKFDQLPAEELPEYAFIGRSNVGKSSMINMLTNVQGLAKTSSTPGKTQLINHFLINEQWYLVDLPGYGFAKVPKAIRQGFSKMIFDYLENRDVLFNVFLLIDSRHDPLENDLEFCNKLGEKEIPFSIIFTKSDKISGEKLKRNVEAFKARLLEHWEELPMIFITSAEKKIGKQPILDYIESINKDNQKLTEN